MMMDEEASKAVAKTLSMAKELEMRASHSHEELMTLKCKRWRHGDLKTSLNVPVGRFAWTLTQMTSVTQLYIRDLGLSNLTPVLGTLKSLQTLHADGNALTDLPDELGQLTKLEDLSLASNAFQRIPSVVRSMVTLETLDLQNNPIVDLGEFPENWITLRSLFVGGGTFEEFPESVSNLKNLQTLHIWNTGLTHLPLSLGKLRMLTNLDVSFNQLVQLPPTLVRCNSLRHLSARENQLTSILPADATGPIWPKLRMLNVFFNKLMKFPRALLEVERTYFRVDVAANQIEYLPRKLRQMPHVSIFAMYNPMTTSPRSWAPELPGSNDPRTLVDLAAFKVLRTTPNQNFRPADVPREVIAYLKNAVPCDNPLCTGYYQDGAQVRKYYWEPCNRSIDSGIVFEWEVCSSRCVNGHPANPVDSPRECLSPLRIFFLDGLSFK